VIFDADKLDSLGAVGVGRVFMFAGGPGGSGRMYTGRESELAKNNKDFSKSQDSALLEYEFKLAKIKDRMLTGSGTKLARRRNQFMEKFFNEFKKEITDIN